MSFRIKGAGLLLVALLLAGCNGSIEDIAPKANKELPQKLVDLMKSKGMATSSPIMVRIFKEEGQFEVWKQKGDGGYGLIASYPICKWSGQLGPKFIEGDRQAPEGFYDIHPSQMNPNSKYYLSFNIGFPNAYDRAHNRTGANLMVHGACSSSGCYSMNDAQVSQIYAFARDAFRGGQINPRHLLVFLKQCDAPASLQPRLRMLDGVWIIPPADADDLNLPRPQWSPIRSEVRFGWLDQGTCLLEGDWSRPEYDGVWTQSDQAGVVIPIQHVQFDTPTPPKSLDLDLKARSRAPTTVSVLVNGVKAGELEIGRATARYTLRLPKSVMRADMLKIRFVLKADEKIASKSLATVTLPSVAGRSAPKVKARPAASPGLGIKLMGLRLIDAADAAQEAAQAGLLNG